MTPIASGRRQINERTDGRADRRADRQTDATKYIISLASWWIKMIIVKWRGARFDILSHILWNIWLVCSVLGNPGL